MEFDWETWSELARTDPEAFERKRKEAIEALIASAPEHQRKRLIGLQSRVDLERQRSSSALGACIRVSNLMWRSFDELQRSLNSLMAELSGDADPAPAKQVTKAEIVQFPIRR